MNILAISIVEAIYVLYMLTFFKTRYNFALNLTKFKKHWWVHPIGHSDKPRDMICKVGQLLGIVIFILLIIRGIVFTIIDKDSKNYNYYVKLNYMILITGILTSLSNLNAFLYVLPVYIVEFIILSKLKNDSVDELL